VIFILGYYYISIGDREVEVRPSHTNFEPHYFLETQLENLELIQTH